MAMEHNLDIIPVINKIDLPSADVEECLIKSIMISGWIPIWRYRSALRPVMDWPNCLKRSSIISVLRAEIPKAPLEALIFDSHYDAYRGVVVHCRIFNGELKDGDEVTFMHTDTTYRAEEVGFFQLGLQKRDKLSAGDVGYVITGVKTISDVRVGDTITSTSKPRRNPARVQGCQTGRVQFDLSR